ncbi:MEDS domain-containing protein [Pseudonocardia sp. HH130630-07]|uniref:MEDS domain-containing protein n=1 Tax=Pseudonocardia sp. HH130630-07 TaxID=1690815 RepID=UPI000814BA73|nr:MEDS domain-containing protein [Pseudonocardia sp. HH130630-07]ANY09197.1 anti-sigma-factor [Pseudonocardia sp. HH130630-07]
MIRLADELSSGDHVCAIPDSAEHLGEISAGYVAHGLARGERVVYLDDDGAADALLRRLNEDGVDVAEPLRLGQFEIVPEEQTRQTFRSPLSDIHAGITGQVIRSLDDGWRGTRLTGQMHAALVPGASGTLPEYDGLLARLIRENERALTALCLFDHDHFPDDQIDIMRALHRDHLAVPGAYDDGLLRIVRIGVGKARLAGQIDHSNRPKITSLLHQQLDSVLRSPDAPADIALDMASVRFIDVASAVAFVHAAESFPVTHRLVLHRVRPRVERILERCGAAFSPQLGFADGAPGPDPSPR